MAIEQVPSVGRIVHYYSGNRCLAAIVVFVYEADHSIKCVYFLDDDWSGHTERAVGVMHDETKVYQHTWHWPERV